LQNDTDIKFLVFQVGNMSCGIDILKIEGLNRVPAITPVFSAPPYVKGLLNLRGQLVTVFDLGKRLGLNPSHLTKSSRIIIVRLNSEYIGLLVDSVIEVVSCQQKCVEKPPPNSTDSQESFFCGIIKYKNMLTTILDIEEIIKVDE
jgi:purine-binding chemotaxis protein CheW